MKTKSVARSVRRKLLPDDVRKGSGMKYVLVTGAYGGMGRATVKRLVSLGFGVFALDRKVEEPEPGVIPVAADVTDAESVRKAAEVVRHTTDELFALVHQAGIYRLDSLVEMSEESFEKVFRVNLFGVFLVNRIFFPFLRRGSRLVITTSELAPLLPLPFTGIYAVSKSALDRYAYALRMELQLLGISVSVLRPGAVRTEMLGDSTAQLEKFCESTSLYHCNAARFRRIVDRVETKNVPPERIAEKIGRILGQKHPAFACSVNRNPLLLLLNALPVRLQWWVIRMVLREK